MTNHDSFFQRQKPAAVLKHSILREYVTVFLSMLGKRGPVWLIDGYAGPGAYGEEGVVGGSRVEGSPLIAAKVAQAWREKSRDLRCVFIEADSVNAASLRGNLAPFGHPESLIVLDGPVEKNLEAARAHVGSSPVITFLDPFGVALPSDLLTSTLMRQPRDQSSEVLLNINVEAVSRLGGCLHLADGKVVPKPGQERSVERVDAFLGDTWWRERFYRARASAANQSAAEAAQQVVGHFRNRIHEATGYSSVSVPIRRGPRHPDLFHLTLFYTHPVAAYKFADAACRATRRWREAYWQQAWDAGETGQGTLFDDDATVRLTQAEAGRREAEMEMESIRHLQSNIAALLQRSSEVRVAENVAEILGDRLGFAGESHIHKAWKQLTDDRIAAPRDTAIKTHLATIRRMTP